MLNCVPVFLKSRHVIGWRGDEIWAVDSQEIIKFVATGCQILSLKINASKSFSAGAPP